MPSTQLVSRAIPEPVQEISWPAPFSERVGDSINQDDFYARSGSSWQTGGLNHGGSGGTGAVADYQAFGGALYGAWRSTSADSADFWQFPWWNPIFRDTPLTEPDVSPAPVCRVAVFDMLIGFEQAVANGYSRGRAGCFWLNQNGNSAGSQIFPGGSAPRAGVGFECRADGGQNVVGFTTWDGAGTVLTEALPSSFSPTEPNRCRLIVQSTTADGVGFVTAIINGETLADELSFSNLVMPQDEAAGLFKWDLGIGVDATTGAPNMYVRWNARFQSTTPGGAPVG